MAMMLTNDTVQLNFVEISIKMVVHQPFAMDDAVIILIDSTRAIQVKIIQILVQKNFLVQKIIWANFRFKFLAENITNIF